MVALKLVDRYLGLHYCSKRICLALAPADQMPEDDQVGTYWPITNIMYFTAIRCLELHRS